MKPRFQSLLWVICIGVFCWLAADVQVVQAAPKTASLVIDADSGRILHSRNIDARRHPASLTKMMTLYMVFDALEQGRLRLNQKLKVSANAAARPPSKLALKRGQTITVKQAIYALVTKSANDVATVVGETLNGSEAAFARAMTAKARSLGMSRTTFRNASGLPDPKQVTTARDMARLALALLDHYPEQYGVFRTRSFSFRGKTYKNHNKLLTSFSGTDGIKTGYIRASGFNLVASAKRGGTRLIAIVFGGKTAAQRNRKVSALLEQGFRAARRLGPQRLSSLSQRDAVAAPPSPRLSPAAGSWGVQVGAFRSRNSAVRTARAAASLTSGVMPDAVVAVEQTEGGTATSFHLARLVGTDRAQAYEACSVLEADGYRCLVVKLKKSPTEVGYAISPAQDKPTSSLSARGTWGVQVGAFSAPSSAERVLQAAIAAVPEPLSGGSLNVVPIPRKEKSTLYGARVIGITRNQAYDACRRLADNDFRCMVVRL